MLLFFFLMIRRPPRSTPFPTRRSSDLPVSIPILPIQTDPLIDIKVLDLLPGRVVAVTGVRWEAGGLTPTGYRVSFQEYWDAIGGPPHKSSPLFMLDLAGIHPADPNFQGAPPPRQRCDRGVGPRGRG